MTELTNDLKAKMPTLSDKIIQSIRDNGPSTTAELAERLGERSRSVSQSLYSDPRATQENSRWIVTDGAYTARENASDARTPPTSSSDLVDDGHNPTDAKPSLTPPHLPEVDGTTNRGTDQPAETGEDGDKEKMPLVSANPAVEMDTVSEDDSSFVEEELGNEAIQTRDEKTSSEKESTPLTQPEPVSEKPDDDGTSTLAIARPKDMEETEFEKEEVSQGIIEGALTAISESASASPIEQIKSTLDYLVAINEREKKVIRDFRKYEFSMTDSEILPLADIETPSNPDSMDDWFRVPRLQTTNPPEPVDEPVRAWLKISKSPHSEPKGYEAITVEVDGEDEQRFWEDAILSDPTLEGLLESYRNDVWSPWAQAEIERQKVIKLYQRLHTIYQTIIAGDQQSLVPEVCVGVGIAAWEIDEEPVNGTLLHPILIQTLDLTLDEDDYSIVINPSQKLTEVASDALSGVSASALNVIKSVKEQLSSLLINPFNRETFWSLLNNVVGGFDPQGKYLEGDECLIPDAREYLQVSENWILFTRRRTTNFLTDDLRKLQELAEETEELPGVAKLLFSDAEDTLRNVARNEYRICPQ